MNESIENRLGRFSLVTAGEGDRIQVSYAGFSQRIMEGTQADLMALLNLLDGEKKRMISEVVEDAKAGKLEGFVGDLDDVCDSNIYPAGGRVADDEAESYPDAIRGWSDIKTREHVDHLLSFGLIGKGIETVDPEDTAASEAFTGFTNAAMSGLMRWIGTGELRDLVQDGQQPVVGR